MVVLFLLSKKFKPIFIDLALISVAFNCRLWTLDDFKTRYAVDNVYYADEIVEKLQSGESPLLLTLTGVNSDSGKTTKEAHFKGIENFKVDNSILFPEICEW